MKTVRHTSGARDKVLHIKTDGGIINITVGLTTATGQPVTHIEILPDDESRGAAPRLAWTLDGRVNSRLIQNVAPFLVVVEESFGKWIPWTPESAGTPQAMCPHCEKVGIEITNVDTDIRFNRGALEFDADSRDSGPYLSFGEAQKNYETDHYECGNCGAWLLVPEGIDELFS